MESSEGRYGWAADDPRWSDALAGGRGRLEASPPRFGADPPPSEPTSELTTAGPDGWLEGAGEPTHATGPAHATSSSDAGPAHATGSDVTAPHSDAPLRPMDPPQWPPTSPTAPPQTQPAPPTQPTGVGDAQPASDTGLAPEPLLPPAPPQRTGRDPFAPPLAIGTAPVPTPVATGNGSGSPAAQGLFVGTASVPSQVPTSVPMRMHTAPPPRAEVELRTGYGLTGAAAAPASTAGAVAPVARTTRLERRVRIRSRWSTEDEFRRAARAELFSDDARYRVLLALTAGWYVPAALVYLAWVLVVRDDVGASGVAPGLLWLGAAAVVSVAVGGLLRWALVGWRALTLSAAAAIIGGGITTIANTLTG